MTRAEGDTSIEDALTAEAGACVTAAETPETL
jgi:hypothetical protein